MKERVQKLFSAAGVCSRRTAEMYILQERVTVNGEIALPGQQADPERDDIRLDNVPLPRQSKKVYIMLNKPRGYVCTLSDEKGRKSVAELVADCHTRVYPVGRLDLYSEGLLILTNDGDLTRRLTHPGSEIPKTYFLSVYGETQDLSCAAERLSQIQNLDGEKIRPAQVRLLRQTGHTADLQIMICEGKNRQIRRMCTHCHLTVKRLRRIQEHTLQLGDLPAGQWRYLTIQEIQDLTRPPK